jgi:FkbM family methyltransferase
MIKKIIRTLVNKLGYSIVKKRPLNTVSYSDQMVKGLKRFSTIISNIDTVIDVGAAAGTWYEKAHQVWPQANYMLFEPLIERTQELEEIKQKNHKVSVIFAALGKEQSKLKFTVSDDLDGSGFYGTGNQREIPVEYLDGIISQEKMKGPYVLKLDTHGFEIPIFEGAADTLKNTELIIVEVYGFYVAPNSLLFWQICEYLDEKGFRLADIVDIMRREKDQAFWQCDAFFIKKTNKIFENNSYA